MTQYKWWLAGGGLLTVVLLAGWAVSSLIGYERNLAIAEEREKSARKLATQQEASQKQFADYLEKSEARLQEMGRAQAQLAQSSVLRQQAYQGQVQAVRSIVEPADIIKQVQDYLKVTAKDVGGGQVSVAARDIQSWILVDLENKKLKADLDDLRKQFEIEQLKTKQLQESLDKALARMVEDRELIEQWRGVAESYKAAAKKSKWRRVLDYAKPIGVAVLAGVIAGGISK